MFGLCFNHKAQPTLKSNKGVEKQQVPANVLVVPQVCLPKKNISHMGEWLQRRQLNYKALG